MADASDPTADSVRALVVSETEAGARGLAEGLATQERLVVEPVASDEVLNTIDAQRVDCVVSDHSRIMGDDVSIEERLREQTDIVYVPVVDFNDWDHTGKRLADETTVPLPKPPSGQLAVLGNCIQTIALHRSSATLKRRALQAFLWELTDELVDAPTQDAIVKRVCERLAGSDHFDGAWICDRQPDPEIRAIAGLEYDRVEQLHDTLEADTGAPWIRAADDRNGHVYAPDDGEHDRKDGRQVDIALASAPLLHRRIVYGVLNVARERPGSRADLSAALAPLTSFGRTVGQALATAEMQTQGETVQQAIEQADPAIAILAEDGTIEYVNAAFESVYGYPKSEAIGSSAELLVPEDIDPTTLLSQVREDSPWREEIVQYGKHDRRFYADLSVAAVPVEGGTRQKYAAVASDITSLKEREQRLEVLNRILRHNLRNDMNVIMGCAKLIADESISDPDSVAADIYDVASDLVAMSEKVRKAASALDQTNEQEEIVLVDLLDRVVEDLTTQYPTGTVDVDVPTEIVIDSNRRQLELVLSNLVENGLEHGGENPTVEISLSRQGTRDETVCLSIRDDGPGIPDHELDPLEKGEETPLEHGSGFGLWLVDAAVTTLGGELSFVTDEGGTTVRVDIPGLIEE